MTSTNLEEQYRAAVRWYPPRWRRRFGEAMVGVLLDVADGEGRTVPATGELVDLRGRGLAEWINVVCPQDVRTLVASISVGAAAAFTLTYFFFVSWPQGFDRGIVTDNVPVFGPFLNAAPLFIAPVLLMFVAAVAGSRVLTHAIGFVALLGVVSAALLRSATGNWNGPGSTTVVFVALLVIFASIGDPRRRLPSLAAFGFVGIASALFGFLQLPTARPWETQFVGDAGWWSIALAPWVLASAGGIVLVSVLVLVARRRTVLAAAIAVAWLPWAAAATVTLKVFAGEEADSFVMAIGSVALCLFAVQQVRTRTIRRGTGDAPTRA